MNKQKQQQQQQRHLVAGIGDLIKVYSDGSVERGHEPVFPALVSRSFNECADNVELREVVVEPKTGVWAKLYLPSEVAQRPGLRVPVVLYFHWGGFIFFRASTPAFQNFCCKVADSLRVMVVSVDYRRAPENRLPAAYEDAVSALEWLRRAHADDPWIAGHADLGRVFLLGESSGASIAFHAALAAGGGGCSGFPGVTVRGAVLVDPNITGHERTASEERRLLFRRSASCGGRRGGGGGGGGFSLELSDLMWRLALPEGSTRDHPWANPVSLVGPTTRAPAMLFVVSGGYVHAERTMELVRRMKECAMKVDVMLLQNEEEHGFGVLRMPTRHLRLHEQPQDQSSCAVLLRATARFIEKLSR